MKELDKKAVRWAEENGFVKPIEAGEAEKIEFPKSGFGFRVLVKEKNGRQRIGTAFFKHDGTRDMWTVDGIITSS